MHNEWIHTAGLGAEAGHAITALLRSAEFELEEWIIFGADDAEIVGHRCETCEKMASAPVYVLYRVNKVTAIAELQPKFRYDIII